MLSQAFSVVADRGTGTGKEVLDTGSSLSSSNLLSVGKVQAGE